MKFVAIEYYSGTSNIDIKGSLRIPDNFSGAWQVGFMNYLKDKHKASNISIYPLNIHLTSDTMGKTINGYINMEDDFILALRDTTYYPRDEYNDNLRRQWSMMSPDTQEFIPTGR